MGTRKQRFVKGSPEALAWGKEQAEKRKAKKEAVNIFNGNSVTVSGEGAGTVDSCIITGTDIESISREQELTKELQVGMPTKAEMRQGKIGMAGRHLRWGNKNADKIAEWKELRRGLYPDDHNAANLENIREEGVMEFKKEINHG